MDHGFTETMIQDVLDSDMAYNSCLMMRYTRHYKIGGKFKPYNEKDKNRYRNFMAVIPMDLYNEEKSFYVSLLADLCKF